MCYNVLVNLAPFVCAIRAMRPRHAVPLTTPKADVCLAPVYPEQRRATPLESTLVEVFILNSLNLFRMNTLCGPPRFAQFWCNLNPFRINTCKSVSKQTTSSPFRMNTYKKHRGGGGSSQTVNSLFTELLYLLNLVNTLYLQKRQRPFRSDGGICQKGAPSSGEKIVTAQRLSFPAVQAEEAHSSEISLGGLARSWSPSGPRTATPPVPSAEFSSVCRSYCQNGDPNACSLRPSSSPPNT